jgi:hypothetical protein
MFDGQFEITMSCDDMVIMIGWGNESLLRKCYEKLSPMAMGQGHNREIP